MHRFHYFYLSLLVYLFSPPQLLAQNVVDDSHIYGLNPILYNGKVYNYFPGSGVKGHQYFEQKDFVEGCISIRGTKYEKVFLNYDILNQQLILKYVDPQGSNRLLTVSKSWLEKFSIADEEFSLIKTTETQSQKFIVQTLNQGQIQLHIHWTKKLIADLSFVSRNYLFENKRPTLYLSYKNDIKEYKSTKDILSLLDLKTQAKVKLYIKQNKIKTRTSSQDQLIGLLNYCNQVEL